VSNDDAVERMRIVHNSAFRVLSALGHTQSKPIKAKQGCVFGPAHGT
jgi:hypothetical protein